MALLLLCLAIASPSPLASPFPLAPPGGRADPLPGAPALDAALQARLREAVRTADTAGRSGAPRFTNRLALEASPYLLGHADNPVNWYAWGEEAFETARRLGRPVFLSIGYSTCHWCHVMERESFEDLEIAEFLNTHFIAVKVDREERPDLDALYMPAIQLWTGGGGGWPMTVFLGADGTPFFGGTYFPPRDAEGRPGLLRVLREVAELHQDNPERVARAQDRTLRALRQRLEIPPRSDALDEAPLLAAAAAIERGFDPEHGGLRGTSKFPSALPLPLLLRLHRRTGRQRLLDMAVQTLDAMRRGGIHDAVGGGFHRYTVDPAWTVPHFEKMLTDNAWLAAAYLDAWQVTQRPEHAAVARDVFEYVAREMTDPSGTFYTASDAESEGREGRYFAWTRAELEAAAGAELAQLAVRAYGLDAPPNFGELHVLRRDRTPAELAHDLDRPLAQLEAELAEIRARLRAAREKRAHPLRDDKQVVAWNGAMIRALARGALLLGDAELGERAVRAADALLAGAYSPEQGLARYLRGGQRHGAAVLDDYAQAIAALIDVFELTGQPRWLDSALLLQRALDRSFWDDAAGGYWYTPAAGAAVLIRSKPVFDEALPSGNAVAALNLLRLYSLTQDGALRTRAEMTLRGLASAAERSPVASAGLLEALDWMLDAPREIAITGAASRAEAEPFTRALAHHYLPNRVLVIASDANAAALSERIPWLAGKRAIGGKPTAYLCTNRVCLRPTADPEEFTAQLKRTASPPGSTRWRAP